MSQQLWFARPALSTLMFDFQYRRQIMSILKLPVTARRHVDDAFQPGGIETSSIPVDKSEKMLAWKVQTLFQQNMHKSDLSWHTERRRRNEATQALERGLPSLSAHLCENNCRRLPDHQRFTRRKRGCTLLYTMPSEANGLALLIKRTISRIDRNSTTAQYSKAEDCEQKDDAHGLCALLYCATRIRRSAYTITRSPVSDLYSSSI